MSGTLATRDVYAVQNCNASMYLERLRIKFRGGKGCRNRVLRVSLRRRQASGRVVPSRYKLLLYNIVCIICKKTVTATSDPDFPQTVNSSVPADCKLRLIYASTKTSEHRAEFTANIHQKFENRSSRI